MNAKKIILAAFAGTALIAAAGAQARDGWRDIHRDTFHRGGHSDHGHYNQGHRGNGHYRHHAHRHYAPAPVYYEPAPVIYGRIPLGHHSSIGFSLPLGY